jgi:hypothetical protein
MLAKTHIRSEQAALCIWNWAICTGAVTWQGSLPSPQSKQEEKKQDVVDKHQTNVATDLTRSQSNHHMGNLCVGAEKLPSYLVPYALCMIHSHLLDHSMSTQSSI